MFRQRETLIKYLHLRSVTWFSLSRSNVLRSFAVLLMPILASKYLSLSLNCVQDLATTSWQGFSLYFAKKHVSGDELDVVGLTLVECVGVRCKCGRMLIVLELM